MLLTVDPEFAHHILQKNTEKYSKTSKTFSTIKHFWGAGLLTSEGEYWHKQRRLIRPGFHRARLKKVFELMEGVAETYLRELDVTLKQNPETNICDNLQRLTFQVIANAIFGTHLHQKEYERLNRIIPRLQAFILKVIRQPYLHWWLKGSGKIKAHEQLVSEEKEMIRSYIQKRRKQKGEHNDLLQMLLDIRYEDTGEGMTDIQLIDEINILFIAGHEPTTQALSWALYLLAQHPEVMKKLREEVNEVIPDAKVTFDRLTQLTYMEQVLEETLRLYPPVWATNRIAKEDDEFKGIKIKKGTTCAAYIYGLHHDPNVWENPTSFHPERFAKGKKKERHTFSFLPFGGGPRFCIGRQFALMEMKLVLAKMVMRYSMELIPGQHIEALPMFNLQPRYGIKMKLSKRRNQIPKRLFPQAKPLERTESRFIPKGCPFHRHAG